VAVAVCFPLVRGATHPVDTTLLASVVGVEGGASVVLKLRLRLLLDKRLEAFDDEEVGKEVQGRGSALATTRFGVDSNDRSWWRGRDTPWGDASTDPSATFGDFKLTRKESARCRGVTGGCND